MTVAFEQNKYNMLLSLRQSYHYTQPGQIWPQETKSVNITSVHGEHVKHGVDLSV